MPEPPPTPEQQEVARVAAEESTPATTVQAVITPLVECCARCVNFIDKQNDESQQSFGRCGRTYGSPLTLSSDWCDFFSDK